MSKKNKGAKRRNCDKKRKKAAKWFLGIIAVLLVAVLATGGVNYYLNQSFTVSFYQITSDKVSSNIRIIELADLHNSEFGENNSKLISRIESLHPDIIVYAGDMMNEGESDHSVLFDLSDKLSKIAPIYACYGNNELDQQLFIDDTFKDQMKKHNIKLLSNEALDVEIGSSVVQLVGISDNLEQFDIKSNNSKRFLKNLEPTENCRICLTHYPELFKEKLLNYGIDVAFTGHAHGGMVRVPYFGGLYSSGEGFLPEFTDGVVTVEDGAKVVISRGLGNSHKIPRINNQPELVVVDICWY